MSLNTAAGTTGSKTATTVAPEPVTGGQDSMTQFLRSIHNVLGTQGANLVGQGTQGAGIAMNQLQKLAGGNEAAVNEATMGAQDTITEGFNRARQMISTMPRGGGTASAEVQAPFKAIKDIAQIKSQAKGEATGQLGSLGAQLAGLGLQSEGEAGQLAQSEHNTDAANTGLKAFNETITAIGSLI